MDKKQLDKITSQEKEIQCKNCIHAVWDGPSDSHMCRRYPPTYIPAQQLGQAAANVKVNMRLGGSFLSVRVPGDHCCGEFIHRHSFKTFNELIPSDVSKLTPSQIVDKIESKERQDKERHNHVYGLLETKDGGTKVYGFHDTQSFMKAQKRCKELSVTLERLANKSKDATYIDNVATWWIPMTQDDLLTQDD